MPDDAAAPTAYLDNAATTPLRPEALEAMLPYLSGAYGNPSGVHERARRARRAIDDSREALAEALGCRPIDVVFTSGGTEADNLAVRGVHDVLGGSVVVSAVEHHAVLRPAQAIGARLAPVDSAGRVDLDRFAALLDDSVRLVSVMAVNSEVGVIQPVAEVIELVRECAPAALVHCDAIQAFPWLDVATRYADCDLVTVSAHKFGGPKGVGALVIRRRAAGCVSPLLLGGSQERGLRAGTENVAAIVGAGVAASRCVAERAAVADRVAALRDRLVDGLLDACPGAVEPAPRQTRVPGNAHLTFPEVEAEELLLLLDGLGVAASSGSACSSGASEPSHVLAAMGWSSSRSRSAVRFSLGYATSEAEVEHALRVVPGAHDRLRAPLPGAGAAGGR